ncbi:MAG: hypothetical protein ISS94_05400 [Candidatus Syntrophoarchaeum sp.]|nr:hypothetical protein [Methanomicrobia archaeon]MBL7118200.1 hypothetical protein [Candidatus Syntrophoarchaeum sp.]
MSKGRNGDRELLRLKKELRGIIDHRIEHNSGFANLLRGDHSLFIFLIAFSISLYVAWKDGFLAPHYVPSLYLALLIWLLNCIRSVKKGFDIGLGEVEQGPSVSWCLRWVKPLFSSLGTLSLMCILVLLITSEKSWWMWTPVILFAILSLLLSVGPVTPVSATSSTENPHAENEGKRRIKVSRLIAVIIFILILAIALIYPYYRIVRELIFAVQETPYSFSEVILTVILILVALVSLSEYLSLKFIVADVSRQNYHLSLLRTDIDEIEDIETLEEKRIEVHELCLPKADSFLLFFNYYYPMYTRYTFEVDEEEEKEESS